MQQTKAFCVLFFTLIISACSSQQNEELKLAINPWPGYEFLYLAEQKGIFDQVGLNVSLLQLGSLADTQRAYLNGYANAMASTMIEAVQSQVLGTNDLKIVLVADYSNGGDVIVANKETASIQDLKGKSVGCEVSSLGIFILQRALAQAGLTLNDVNVKNIEQNMGVDEMSKGLIDAFVTYPPVSIELLKQADNHTVFSSAEIPREIIDVVSISSKYLKQNPDTVNKLRQAWQLALDFYQQHPEEAVSIMATREGISSEDFNGVISDLQILNLQDQTLLFSQPEILETSVQEVCKTLYHVGSIESDCKQLPSLIYRSQEKL